MAGAVVGSAEFQLAVNIANFNAGFDAAQRAAQAGSEKIQRTIDNNLKKTKKSADEAGIGLKKAFEIGGAISGVAFGLEGVRKALEVVVEQTAKAAQAQFALNKVYGDAAGQYKAFADAQSQATGRNSVDFQQASVRAATLAKNYGLTSQQIQELIKRSSDLAAVHGKEIPDAAERVINAIRGEAEAAEALGLTLNSDAVKAFADMTDEQRKNFESLDQVTKAQIIYRELLRQTNDVQGAAAEQAKTATGQFQALQAATDKLAASLGGAFSEGLGEAAGVLAGVVSQVATLVEKTVELQRLSGDPAILRYLALTAAPQLLPGQLIRGSGIAERAGEAIFGADQIRRNREATRGVRDAIRGVVGDSVADYLDPRARAERQAQADAGLGGPAGAMNGPSADEIRAATTVAVAERKRQAKEILDVAKQNAEDLADARIKGLEKEKQAVERAYDQQRIAAEKARDAEIKAAEDTRDGAIKAIEQQAEATAESYRRQIAEAERARDGEKQAAEDQRDQQLRALAEVERAAKDANDAAIRQAEISRDREKQAAEDKRDDGIRALDDEKRARDNARVLEDRAREDETRDALRAIETQHDAAVKALADELKAAERKRDGKLRALDREADRARATSERTIRAIEDQKQAEEDRAREALAGIEREADAEDERYRLALDGIERAADAESERHRLAMQALDDEQDARLDALDVQLRALDAQKQQADAAAKLADLNRKAADIQRNLDKARGTGDPNAIRAAQQALQQAIRAQDQLAAGRARQVLDAAAGTGDPEAIRKLEQDLADVQEEIRREGVEQAQDAERDKLEAAKDAIKEEIDARRRAEDDQNRQRERELQADRDAEQERNRLRKVALDADRDAADERTRLRQRELDGDTQAEQNKLKRRLDALDRRKEATRDAAQAEIDGIKDRQEQEKEAHDEAVRLARDAAEEAKRAVDDRRRAEDQADQDKRRQINDTYELEQRQIKATYDDEETGIIPALRRAADAAEREFGRQRQAVQDAYDEEQRRIKETYDDPVTGVLAKLREQAQAAADSFRDQKTAVNERYQAERDRIKEVYDDPENGIFAKLKKAKDDTIESLNGQVEKWRDWKRDTVKEIDDALSKLDEFVRKIGDLKNLVISTPTPDGTVPVPGGTGPVIPGINSPRDPGGNAAYAPVVRGASADSYWTSGGTHGGHPAADIFAPIGTPIYAPIGGTSSPGTWPLGGNTSMLVGDDGRAYYFAHGAVPFKGGRVEKGEAFGQVGDTGNAKGTSPHLHFAISSRGTGLFGEWNGSGDIDGDSSWWTTGARMDDTRADGQPGGEYIDLIVQGQRIRLSTRGGGDFVGPNGGQGENFRRLLAQAQEAARKYDLPAAIMAAIPINEGLTSQLQTKYHNLFSIKGTGPAGSVSLPTEEVINGQRVLINDDFRVYHNEAESFLDFGKLITESGIYDDAVEVWRKTRDPKAFMRTMGRKYATDPNFAEQVLKIAGYRNGTMIQEPTLLAGLRSGRLGIAGETGQPERLLGVEATRAYGGGASGDVFNFYGVQPENVHREQDKRRRQRDWLFGRRGT